MRIATALVVAALGCGHGLAGTDAGQTDLPQGPLSLKEICLKDHSAIHCACFLDKATLFALDLSTTYRSVVPESEIDSLIEDFVDSAHAQCDQKRKGADAAPASP